MRVVVETDLNGLKRFRKVVGKVASGDWRKEAGRGLSDAGKATKTQVQRAVHHQMATALYGFVSRNTRGTLKASDLGYEIWSPTRGQPVENFKGLTVLKWVRSGPLAGPEAGQVRSGVWNAPRVFKRSFANDGGYYATLPGPDTAKVAPKALWTFGAKPGQGRDADGRFLSTGKVYGPVRRLYGPALRDELGKDESLATFHKVAPQMLVKKVVPRIAKFVKF